MTPKEIYYTIKKNKVVLKINKKYLPKLKDSVKKVLKANFKRTKNGFESLSKNSVSFLESIGIREKKKVIKKRTVKVLKPQRKELKLVSESKSNNYSQPMLTNINVKLKVIENNQKILANEILKMKPKISKLESDMKTIQSIVND